MTHKSFLLSDHTLLGKIFRFLCALRGFLNLAENLKNLFLVGLGMEGYRETHVVGLGQLCSKIRH